MSKYINPGRGPYIRSGYVKPPKMKNRVPKPKMWSLRRQGKGWVAKVWDVEYKHYVESEELPKEQARAYIELHSKPMKQRYEESGGQH